GTLYRGKEGMLSWVAHRITGVVFFLFLLVYEIDNELVRVSPQAYDAVIVTYKNWYMAIGEAGLVAAVVYHAFNGIRVVLIDLWKKGTKYQTHMLWTVLILWVVVFGGFFIRHLMLVLGG